MPHKHTWIDHARKTVTSTNDDAAPHGCVLFSGAVPHGYTVTAAFAMQDRAPAAERLARDNAAVAALARVGLALPAPMPQRDAPASFPAAGRSHLMADTASLDVVLAACPASTRDLRDKVARQMIGLDHARDGAFQDGLSNLRSFAAHYGSLAFSLPHAGARDACAAAAQSVTQHIDGMVMARDSTTRPPADREGARAAMVDRVSNGWRA